LCNYLICLKERRAIKSKEPVQQTTKEMALTFRWSYIVLPMVILILTIILIACFYHRLPVEVAYHFQSDGSPDRWLSRGAVILLVLLPQLFFTLLAGAITWGVVKLGAQFGQPESTWIRRERIILLIGNMIALPQIILCFAMLRIFIYNSYQIHILPLWVFALIIMGLGGIVLGIFFIRAFRHVWKTNR
jgi:uncharacterized membrane protein